MLALPFMMHSKKYPNAIHDHEIEVMVKNVAFFAMLASHMGPTFKQRQNMIIIMFISYIAHYTYRGVASPRQLKRSNHPEHGYVA